MKNIILEEVLKEFEERNGYSFFDTITDKEIRRKHNLKQKKKKSYDDDDFLEKFQHLQGETRQ